MKFPNLNRLTPLVLRNGQRLRNRVVIPPMASQTADTAGLVTERTLEHYLRLAQAQPGLLIAEYTFVDESGRSEENQLGISSDSHLEGLTRLACLIRDSGALAGIQFSHGGGKTERSLTGGVLMGPSAIAVPVKDRELERPTPMTLSEISYWREAFVRAADRAAQAGFDLIELHAAHGYGLNQWLSPLTNQRTDAFGENLEGRMRLLLEIVGLIRLRHPGLLISVRMPGQDFLEGGLSREDSIRLARELERQGVDLIHVSSGIGGWKRPSERIGQGYLVAEASAIQAQVKVPVIGVGGVESSEYIDQSLQDGRFSLAAVGRAILKNPAEWGQAQLETHGSKSRNPEPGSGRNPTRGFKKAGMTKLYCLTKEPER